MTPSSVSSTQPAIGGGLSSVASASTTLLVALTLPCLGFYLALLGRGVGRLWLRGQCAHRQQVFGEPDHRIWWGWCLHLTFIYMFS